MENSLALIIGVGPGLGMALAQKFNKEYDVCMVARNVSKLESLARQMTDGTGKVTYYGADAGNRQSLEDALNKILMEQGTPEVMIYNVSLLRQATPLDIPYSSFVEDFQINVGGLLTAYQVIFPAMRKKGKGTILITGGGLSLKPYYEFASLSVGKAGLRNLAESLAQDANKSGIRVATITVNGMIEPNTKFDSVKIADKFMEIFKEGLAPGEFEFVFE